MVRTYRPVSHRDEAEEVRPEKGGVFQLDREKAEFFRDRIGRNRQCHTADGVDQRQRKKKQRYPASFDAAYHPPMALPLLPDAASLAVFVPNLARAEREFRAKAIFPIEY
jgi:hypothetical protein